MEILRALLLSPRSWWVQWIGRRGFLARHRFETPLHLKKKKENDQDTLRGCKRERKGRYTSMRYMAWRELQIMVLQQKVSIVDLDGLC
ncbi:hypothetical protein TNCT_60521 [Trichonephila clavata]|uniref:Uncharacterized protein n=1 Tax=Trichonephila clavata TaxID=2740835 RepID=A0A8X6FCP2_TRICU|nr:hypothetical protein TNCT_60521 [Trichonephila clavata]